MVKYWFPGAGGGTNGEMLVKWYKLSVTKGLRTYLITLIDHTVFFNRNLLREQKLSVASKKEKGKYVR